MTRTETSATERASDLHPRLDFIGEYRVVKPLGETRSTLLCRDNTGRQVVLKQLESDCLLGPRLHPSIKERLMRVRELAQRQVATLRTVEQDPQGGAWLVWDYVEGKTFEEYIHATDRDLTPRRRINLAREIMLSVDALHSLGIVHGSLHARNVILGPGGQVNLTHINPLLYNDPADDTVAIVKLLDGVVALPAVDPQRVSLRQLAAMLAAAETRSDVKESDRVAELEVRSRRRSLLAAAIVSLLAMAATIAIYRVTSKRPPPPSWENLGRLDAAPAAK